MKKLFIPLLACLVIFACAKPEDNTDNTTDGTEDNPSIIAEEIHGFAQKGQLIKGSQITAYALGSDLIATGESFPAQISDDMGTFKIIGRTTAPIFELNAQGYYFVENTGEISTAPIYLQTVVNSGQASVNLNLLTSLIAPRIKKLMSEGTLFKDAELQAQSELMRSLGYEGLTYQLFSEMNIAGESNSDAILLAASCLLQEGRTTGEVQAMITDIASSLEKYGSVSESLTNKLFEHAGDIDIWEVAKGLVEYYEQKDIEEFKVPPFYVILDEKYSSGIHFFETGPEYIETVNAFGCNVDRSGKTETHVVLCTEDFDVVSQNDWITVEKTHYVADFYMVKITIDANPEDIRTGTVQYRIHRGGSAAIEREDTYKQMSGYPRLYVELPSSGGGRASLEHSKSLEAGEKVSVNGIECELKNDEIGSYINVKEKADYYRVCYPVNSKYTDANGNEVSFAPVQCYGEDYYYATVTCPASGYPTGVYPFYGILADTDDSVMTVELKACTVGLMIIVDGVEVKDNLITLVADQDMFGEFSFSNYLNETELALNPEAVVKEPVVVNGVKESTHILKKYESSSDIIYGDDGVEDDKRLSTNLLQIPVQNYNFKYFNKQISDLKVLLEYRDGDYVREACLILPITNYLDKEGRVLTVTLSLDSSGEWWNQSFSIREM